MDKNLLAEELEQLIGRFLTVTYDIGNGPQIEFAELQKVAKFQEVDEYGLQLKGGLSLDSCFPLDFGSVIEIRCQGATIFPEPTGEA